MRRAPAPLSDLTEKEWDAQLFNRERGLAPSLGWGLTYHTLRSKGSQPGFPDRVLVRERVIFAELKREGAKPTERQVAWLDGLAGAGQEVYLWRPSDLDEVGKILSRRWQVAPVGLHPRPCLTAEGFELLEPASMWLVGGRADEAGS